jgi:hypothetical protein
MAAMAATEAVLVATVIMGVTVTLVGVVEKLEAAVAVVAALSVVTAEVVAVAVVTAEVVVVGEMVAVAKTSGVTVEGMAARKTARATHTHHCAGNTSSQSVRSSPEARLHCPTSCRCSTNSSSAATRAHPHPW